MNCLQRSDIRSLCGSIALVIQGLPPDERLACASDMAYAAITAASNDLNTRTGALSKLHLKLLEEKYNDV